MASSALSGDPSPQSQIFAPESWPVLFAVADAIVPRFRDQPAASEIDLLPRLERCIELSPDGAEMFRAGWSRFEQALRQHVPAQSGRLDPAVLQQTLEAWQVDYATQLDPPLAASYFEGLRRNVLLAYYTSPVGWASSGYHGPGEHAPSATGAHHE